MADFVLESREHLTSIEQRILTLERDPADTDAIHSVFRGFHSIKGLAGFLEFAAIQEVAHEVETALNLVREGKLAIVGRVIDVILESVDYLSGAIATVESGGAVERAPQPRLATEKGSSFNGRGARSYPRQSPQRCRTSKP